MEEYQDVINAIDIEKDMKYPNAKNEISGLAKQIPIIGQQKDVYGIEKDYRLVKVAKSRLLFFIGDGVAQILHSDGLHSFRNL